MKLRRRALPAITTQEAHRAQFEHHLKVQETVKRVYPASALAESASVYAAIGQEDVYQVIRAYLQLIALNEAEGNDWNFVVDAAFADARLGDTDLEAHFIPLVLELQRRAMFEMASEKEVKAGFVEMLTWKVSDA